MQKRGRAAELRGSKKDGRNTGVEERAARDKQQASNPSSKEREVYDRLLKKAKLYDKLGVYLHCSGSCSLSWNSL